MKVFKFRAWDEMNKLMHNDFQFVKSGNEGNDWILFVSDRQPISSYEGWVKNPYFQQQLKIMQFTGLLDRSGKDIYEGDILAEKGNLHRTGTIRYEANIAAFMVFVNGGYCHLNEGDWNKGNQLKYTEVIGNIYENPEMLNSP